MKYKALQRDLTESTEKCYFCGRPLRSLTAYILKETNSDNMVYSGRKCAADNIDDPSSLSDIPDFTRYTKVTSQSDGSGGSGGTGGANVVNTKRNAMEYLILREDKLREIPNCSYHVLKKYYEKSRKQELSEDELEHINNIEAKAPGRIRRQTLHKIYNYLFWIDVAIEKLSPKERQFLEGIRAYIIEKSRITKAQKVGVNNWLKNIDGCPSI